MNENKPPENTTQLSLAALPNAPSAERREHKYTHHGYTVSDPWNWIRDSDYPKTDDIPVLDYLKAENTYYQTWLAPQKALVDTLFDEYKGRLDETETSVPWTTNGFEYRWVYREGEEYRTYLRRPVGAPDSEELVILDETKLAKDHEYFVVGSFEISHDNKLLSYSIDTEGDERYTIRVKKLSNNQHLDDVIENTDGELLFTHDGSLVYGALQAKKWHVKSINRHIIGQKVTTDKILLAEQDESYFMNFSQTSDEEYLLIGAGKGGISEYYALNQNKLDEPLQLLASRDLGFEYTVDHAHGKFWFLANDEHVNSRMANVTDNNPAYENWQTVIPGSDQVYLKSLQTFKDLIAIKQSTEGLEQLVLRDYTNAETTQKVITFPEDVFTASFFNNPEFAQSHLRIRYSSMITPNTVFDYNIDEDKLIQRKIRAIPSGYDKSQYKTKRIMITARDGTQVPVSLMFLKGTKFDGSNPLHLYGYGAYGSGMPASFSTIRLSLVNRGVIYAIAHVRGGDEMGYQWYLDGKLKKRENTFNDFVDVAQALITQKYTRSGNISISGHSAGGELMGAVVIKAPALWSSVILGVPFVDVLNTMLDATLPLTPPEWSQWGNPIEDKAAFELIRQYSPYDNIEARDYPPMLVLGGLNDPRVTYWEPAKWTASMRYHKTDKNLLMMRMNMGAGHFSNSGRYGRLRDYAEEFAFTLISHNINE